MEYQFYLETRYKDEIRSGCLMLNLKTVNFSPCRGIVFEIPYR